MKKIVDFLRKLFKEAILDDNKRLRFQYLAVFGTLCVVALLMSIVNIFTNETHLLVATGLFSFSCLVCFLITIKHKEKTTIAATLIFIVSFISLFTFFIVTGHPQGFSCIWLAMLPTSGMVLFKKKNGTFMSMVMLVILLFFFYTPFGKDIILKVAGEIPYTETFMLRFPMLYVAFYFVALFLETLLETTYDQYKRLYTHDPLTDALNRIGFNNLAEDELKKAKFVTILMFDLDDFKKINDNYGHLCGDEVLKATVEKISSLVNYPVCRWGGEEFAVIIPDIEFTEEDAKEIVKKFSEIEVDYNNKKIKMTISMGAVTINNINLGVTGICNLADECLYIAKENGKNQAVFKNLTNGVDNND